MTIEEFIKHQAVSGCLAMEDKQYLELRDVEKVLQMEREALQKGLERFRNEVIENQAKLEEL
jgi:hypothetical protein